jgi:hypothetical protein
MSDQPATDDDDDLDDPWHDQLSEIGETFGGPDVLALVAFVTAVTSLLGLGLMNGTAYVVPFLDLSGDGTKTRIVAGTLLGAVLAMLPVLLGWRANARLLDTDPSWVGVLARTAVLLGLASGALRLVIAIVESAHDGPSGFTRL